MPVSSPEEMLQLFQMGNASRHERATGMNDTSSRSHLLFVVNVTVHNIKNKKTTLGKLTLVDLAGSERLVKTNLTDKHVS